MDNSYNEKKESIIDSNHAVSDFQKWNKNDNNKYSCFQHRNGFFVFLNDDEIGSSDEYRDDDPYTVVDNLNSSFHKRRFNCTIELIKNFVTKKDLRLLDIGCGQGHITHKIKEVFPNFEVYGLDYSISAIDYANSNFKNIDFVVANAYQPPFSEEYFDIIKLIEFGQQNIKAWWIVYYFDTKSL
jgi:23S rRNA (guanine745-N1)-methyltransferase